MLSSQLWSQDSLRLEKFNRTILRMDKIMMKTGGSIEHLKVIYRQLEELSDVDEGSFNTITGKYADYVFNERIYYIGEMTEIQEFERALVSLAILQQEYPDNNQVKSLAIVTKVNTYDQLLKNLKESRTSYTIEPSLSIFNIGKPFNEFAFLKSPGINLMYSLGAYKIYNVHVNDRKGFKKRFTFSQIGLKLDYFNGSSKDGSSYLSYLNTQISYIMNRSIGLDLGYASVFNTSLPTDKGLYTLNISAHFPIDFMSLGMNARILSDFGDVNQIQYGISLKYIFKLRNKLTPEDTENIHKSIKNIDFE